LCNKWALGKPCAKGKIMRIPLLVSLALLSALLIGCGGSSGIPSPVNPTPAYPNLAGNWTVTADSTVTGAQYELGGYMTNTGASVTATFYVYPFAESNCYPSEEAIPFTGTVTTSGAISLTSGSVANQTITMAGSISGGSSFTATYEIAGGCAAGDAGLVLARAEPSYTGDYTGTLQSLSGSDVNVSVNMVQSGPNADGEYSVSGTAQFSGTSCFTTGTITSSTIFGEYVQFAMSMDNGGAGEFTGAMVPFPGSIMISGEFQVTAGSCAGNSFGVTISTALST